MKCEEMHSESSNGGGLDEHLKHKRWGQIPTQSLPTKISAELNEIYKKIKPVWTDEPLLPTICQSPSDCDAASPIPSSSNYFLASNSSVTSKSGHNSGEKQSPVQIQPSIDSYIVKTIKLNDILKSNTPFDQVEFFQKYEKRKETSKDTGNRKQNKPSVFSQVDRNGQMAVQSKIYTDEEARKHIRRFITIMAMHTGFTHASSVGLDILVDVLEHYVESFFKLLKNLQAIHQFDPASNDSTEELASNNHYSTQKFIEQAFKESGIGSLEKLKDFYVNDVIEYHRQTYKKVSKLYEEHKKKKMAERLAKKNGQQHQMDAAEVMSEMVEIKTDNEIKMEEFMRENDFLNEESSTLLGDLLLGDLGAALPYKHLSYILD